MGNKIGRRKQVVDEKYTRPQGLYQNLDIDHKKLRKLILDAKLAPCYPEDDVVCTVDLEECPICFLYYPSLNRSKCCAKGLCTECFLQMKPTYSSSSVQCPFCKTSNYAVEYRGAKTKEEKSVEQFEEQRVIEAQIRIQQQELQDQKERMQLEENRSYSSRTSCFSSSQDDEVISSEGSCNASTCAGPSYSRQKMEGNSDLEHEDLMVMEALWKSIQEQEIHRFSSDDNTCSLPEFNWSSSVQTNADCQYFDICSTIVSGIGEPISVNFSSGERSVAGHFPAASYIRDPKIRRTIIAHDNDSIEAETETSNNILSVSIDAESLEGEAIQFPCASPGVAVVL